MKTYFIKFLYIVNGKLDRIKTRGGRRQLCRYNRALVTKVQNELRAICDYEIHVPP